ncbi:hypothetical protein [Paraburkholderia sp. D1E]|uniref:hypothetical protein n=1 Tax=Paraburkholderia sp. D1E TaxID=3461398 RepID=UPI004045F376
MRVAWLGSISAATRKCWLSQPQVSRIITDFESVLRARPLTRTTCTVMMMDADAELLSRLDPTISVE